MADRQLQAILSSGEITSMNIGGTDSGDAVAKISDITPSICVVGTTSGITSQSLVAGVPEKLTFFDTSTITIGPAISSSIANQQINLSETGIYSVSGTISIKDGNQSQVHKVTLYVNSNPTPFMGSIQGDGNIVFIGAGSYSQGDDLELYIESTSNSIEIILSSMTVEKI